MKQYDYVRQGITKWEETHPEPKDPGYLEYLDPTILPVVPALEADRIWLEVHDNSERIYYSYRGQQRGEIQMCLRINHAEDGNDHFVSDVVIIRLEAAKALAAHLAEAIGHLEMLVQRHAAHEESTALYESQKGPYNEQRNAEWQRLSREWEAMQSKEERVFDDDEPRYLDEDGEHGSGDE